MSLCNCSRLTTESFRDELDRNVVEKSEKLEKVVNRWYVSVSRDAAVALRALLAASWSDELVV
jgi:hypothetical protein